MIWQCSLISLTIGIIIGATAMLFGSKTLRKNRHIQYELEKLKIEFSDYRKKCTNHFEQSAKLLDHIERDYHQLYQHIITGSNELLLELPYEKKSYSPQLTESSNEQVQVTIPRDYSEGSSGLLND